MQIKSDHHPHTNKCWCAGTLTLIRHNISLTHMPRCPQEIFAWDCIRNENRGTRTHTHFCKLGKPAVTQKCIVCACVCLCVVGREERMGGVLWGCWKEEKRSGSSEVMIKKSQGWQKEIRGRQSHEADVSDAPQKQSLWSESQQTQQWELIVIGEITGRSSHRPPPLQSPRGGERETEGVEKPVCRMLRAPWHGNHCTTLAPDNASVSSFTLRDVALKGCCIISPSQTAIGSPLRHRALFTHLLDNNYLALWLRANLRCCVGLVPQSIVVYGRRCARLGTVLECVRF